MSVINSGNTPHTAWLVVIAAIQQSVPSTMTNAIHAHCHFMLILAEPIECVRKLLIQIGNYMYLWIKPYAQSEAPQFISKLKCACFSVAMSCRSCCISIQFSIAWHLGYQVVSSMCSCSADIITFLYIKRASTQSRVRFYYSSVFTLSDF